MSGFNDKIKVHTAPGSGTQYVHTIDLLYTQEEKNALYEEAMKQAEQEMSERYRNGECLICGAEGQVFMLDLRVMGSEDAPICRHCETELITHIHTLRRIVGDSRKRYIIRHKEPSQ